MIILKAILYILLYGFIAVLVGGMIKYLNEKYNYYMAEDAILCAIMLWPIFLALLPCCAILEGIRMLSEKFGDLLIKVFRKEKK